MKLIIRHFSRASALHKGAEYYYDCTPGTMRCPKCHWFSPRVAKTDECLSCRLETFVTRRSVTIGPGGPRCEFSIDTSVRAREVFREWPTVKAWCENLPRALPAAHRLH